MRPLSRSLFLAALLPLAASAQLTVIQLMRFDVPSDPWLTSGLIVVPDKEGEPTIQSTVLAPIAGNVASAQFSSAAYAWGAGNFLQGDTDGHGYGVQIWVRNAASSGGDANIASFGSPQDGGNGISISVASGQYSAWVYRTDAGSPQRIATVAAGGAGSISGWDHLALVYDPSLGASGTTRFFVNGTQQVSYTSAAPVAPSDGWHQFVNPGGGTTFSGYADDLKYFTFTPGSFTAAQLDFAAAAIPEPAAFAGLIGALALVGAAWRRRFR